MHFFNASKGVKPVDICMTNDSDGCKFDLLYWMLLTRWKLKIYIDHVF